MKSRTVAVIVISVVWLYALFAFYRDAVLTAAHLRQRSTPVSACALSLVVVAGTSPATFEHTLRSVQQSGLLELVSELVVTWSSDTDARMEPDMIAARAQVAAQYNARVVPMSHGSHTAAPSEPPASSASASHAGSHADPLVRGVASCLCSRVMYISEGDRVMASPNDTRKRLAQLIDLLDAEGAHLIRISAAPSNGARAADALWRAAHSTSTAPFTAENAGRCRRDPHLFCASSRVAPLTLEPALCTRDFFMSELADRLPAVRAGQAAAQDVQMWWQRQRYVVAASEVGLVSRMEHPGESLHA